MFPTKPLSACLESVKVPAKIPRSSFLTDGKLPIISQESDFINGYWDNEADAIHVESPVVVFGDHTQVLKLIDFDFVVGADGVKILKPKEFLDAAFLRYFLEANPIPSLGYARHFRHISGISVPLPPPDEQKRIVTVLDQAFAALDRARAHAEANLADSRLLFESAVDGLICRNRSGWQEDTFEQLVGDVFTGPFGSLLHMSDYIEGGTPIVNPSNIIDGRIEPDWRKTITDEAVMRLTSYKLRVGDLVIGRRGEMGRCAPVLENMEGWLCGTGSFVIRPKAGVSSEFVACVLRTPTMVEKLSSLATGATMLNLSNRTLAQMPFALPSYEEQLDMLEAIKRLEGRTKTLHSEFNLKVSELTNLRQSLLQKAFSGNLMPD